MASYERQVPEMQSTDRKAQHNFAQEQESNDLQLINVGVEDLVHKADRGRFVRILIWQLDVDFPHASSEGS